MDIRQQKRQLREDIRRRLAGLPGKERVTESRSLCRRIVELLPKEPSTICAFAPLAAEPDILPLLSELLVCGHVLFLPRVEQGRMVFRQVTDLSALAPGSFNILEPPANAPLLDASALGYALVPGTAFDRAGNRLGRGNGGYDHWIAAQRQAHSQTKFWGICFECQLVQEVPVDQHDARLDGIVTARGPIEVGR